MTQEQTCIGLVHIHMFQKLFFVAFIYKAASQGFLFTHQKKKMQYEVTPAYSHELREILVKQLCKYIQKNELKFVYKAPHWALFHLGDSRIYMHCI